MKCDKCGEEKHSAMKRMSGLMEKLRFTVDAAIGLDPTLCQECCAQYPGREWMRDAYAR